MLMDHFQQKYNLTKAMTLMIQCKPKSLTNLYKYVFEKLSLIQKMQIFLTNADKVNLILRGINDLPN